MIFDSKGIFSYWVPIVKVWVLAMPGVLRTYEFADGETI